MGPDFVHCWGKCWGSDRSSISKRLLIKELAASHGGVGIRLIGMLLIDSSRSAGNQRSLSVFPPAAGAIA